MHDLDQPVWGLKAEFEFDDHEDTAFTSQEFEYEGGAGSVLDSGQEMEMASDLLSVNSEEELDQFLGDFFKKVSRKIGRGMKGPMGKFLGGALKNVAKAALPTIGSALGTFVAPGLGTAAGGALGAAAGNALGLELEGLSPEDQEFEAARRVVRLGADAVASATANPQAPAAPAQAARQALANAAKRHAPGLLNTNGARSASGAGGGGGAGGSLRTGRWIRRGGNIILLGA